MHKTVLGQATPICYAALLRTTRPPYTYRVIITRRSQHLGSPRVPANTVYGLQMARQDLDWVRTPSVPYVDLQAYIHIVQMFDQRPGGLGLSAH